MNSMCGLVAIADLDTFYVSVERLLNPDLRGKPVIVGGDARGRGIVASCSYEARAYGIKSGMSARDALRLCPHVIILPGHIPYYPYYSRLVGKVLAEFTPDCEALSIDEFLLDFTGMERIYPDPWTLASTLRERVYLVTGLPISIGIASSAVVAKVASSVAKPDGFIVVPRGQEAEFLNPLPVGKLPGVGEVTELVLARQGVTTIGELAQMPRPALRSHFGRWGDYLWEKARGIGGADSWLGRMEEAIPRSIGHQTAFPATAEPSAILAVLHKLVLKCGYRLRSAGLTTQLVAVKYRTVSFERQGHQRSLPTPLFADEDIFSVAKCLLQEIYPFGGSTRLRKVGVRLSRLARASSTIPVFASQQYQQKQALYRAVDEVHERFGLACLTPLAMLQEHSSDSPWHHGHPA